MCVIFMHIWDNKIPFSALTLFVARQGHSISNKVLLQQFLTSYCSELNSRSYSIVWNNSLHHTANGYSGRENFGGALGRNICFNAFAIF